MRTAAGRRLPWNARLFNALARGLQRVGVGRVSLEDESILAAARRETGLEDFGDGSFREPLGRLLRSFRDEAALHPLGRLIVRQRLLLSAANRLRIRDDLKRHPEILDVPLRRPLIVTGLPRTGTTLLHHLLAQDPAGRPLRFWEATRPSPPPTPKTDSTDPRIAQAEQAIRRVQRLVPGFMTYHPMRANGPEECMPLLFNTFVCSGFLMMADLPGYETWLRGLGTSDLVPGYEEYRRQLQLLKWRTDGEHWVLKCPVHTGSLGALWRVFPDACVVQMHRDPCRAVPSLCSFFATFRSAVSDGVRPEEMGPRLADSCVELLRRADAARAESAGRLCDVRYQDLLGDPIGTVHRVYEHFGYRRSETMDQRMRQWLADNPQHKHGVHRYRLADFGLDEAAIRRRFSRYCETHRIEPERPPA